jgi:hypothetical protein
MPELNVGRNVVPILTEKVLGWRAELNLRERIYSTKEKTA